MKSIIVTVTIIGLVFILLVSATILNQKETEGIPEPEKAKIEDWIERNDLNRYGDSKDRIYRGGTPLFNEGTGESLDRYKYILKNHPDRPWLKLK